MNWSLVIPEVKEKELSKTSSSNFYKVNNKAKFQSKVLKKYFSSQLYKLKN